MADFQLDLYSLFGLIEVIIVLLVAAGWLLLRSRLLSSRVRSLQQQLSARAKESLVDFSHYLREEILRNQALCETLSAAGTDGQQAAERLSVRRQFLDLELSAQEFADNPQRFQNALTAGVADLLERWRPAPETAAVAPDTEATDTPETAAAEPAPAPGGTETDPAPDTQEEEFDRLKQVILNQQDAMAALRKELRARESEIDNLDSILSKLDEFERHDVELQRCLQILEQENQRLKQAREGDQGKLEMETLDSAHLKGLKAMIGNQHETIANLQNLIQELAPEASKAAELEAAIAGIQRANQELSGCVAVLEDENAMLRAELDAVHAQLEQDAAAPAGGEAEPDVAVVESEPAPGEAQADEEKYQLEIKVQELEALVEFKDAALEELEKQYHSLEAKYLALSGEK